MDDARDLLSAFGAAVRAQRESLPGGRGGPMSQEELAELAGLHRTYVGSLERGERNVALINLDRLARALGVSLPDLLAETNSRRRHKRLTR